MDRHDHHEHPRDYFPGPPAGPDDTGTDVSSWPELGSITDGAGTGFVHDDAPGIGFLPGRPEWLDRYVQNVARYPGLPKRTGWEVRSTAPEPIDLTPGEQVGTSDAVRSRVAAAVGTLAALTGRTVEDVWAAIEAAAAFDDTGRRVRTTLQGARPTLQLHDEVSGYTAGKPDELHRIAAKHLPAQNEGLEP